METKIEDVINDVVARFSPAGSEFEICEDENTGPAFTQMVGSPCTGRRVKYLIPCSLEGLWFELQDSERLMDWREVAKGLGVKDVASRLTSHKSQTLYVYIGKPGFTMCYPPKDAPPDSVPFKHFNSTLLLLEVKYNHQLTPKDEHVFDFRIFPRIEIPQVHRRNEESFFVFEVANFIKEEVLKRTKVNPNE